MKREKRVGFWYSCFKLPTIICYAFDTDILHFAQPETPTLASKYVDTVAVNSIKEKCRFDVIDWSIFSTFIFIMECENSLLFFEVSNIELFFTFLLSISVQWRS